MKFRFVVKDIFHNIWVTFNENASAARKINGSWMSTQFNFECAMTKKKTKVIISSIQNWEENISLNMLFYFCHVSCPLYIFIWKFLSLWKFNRNHFWIQNNVYFVLKQLRKHIYYDFNRHFKTYKVKSLLIKIVIWKIVKKYVRKYYIYSFESSGSFLIIVFVKG